MVGVRENRNYNRPTLKNFQFIHSEITRTVRVNGYITEPLKATREPTPRLCPLAHPFQSVYK